MDNINARLEFKKLYMNKFHMLHATIPFTLYQNNGKFDG
jgi:hypothetical protein